jgi:hypothetical protein
MMNSWRDLIPPRRRRAEHERHPRSRFGAMGEDFLAEGHSDADIEVGHFVVQGGKPLFQPLAWGLWDTLPPPSPNIPR